MYLLGLTHFIGVVHAQRTISAQTIRHESNANPRPRKYEHASKAYKLIFFFSLPDILSIGELKLIKSWSIRILALSSSTLTITILWNAMSYILYF